MSRFIPIASTIFYFLYISDIIVRIKYDWILESLLQDEFSRGIPRNRGIPRKITMSGKRSEMVDGGVESPIIRRKKDLHFDWSFYKIPPTPFAKGGI